MQGVKQQTLLKLFTGIFDYIKFNLSPASVPNEEGVISWNNVDKTIDVNQGGGVVQQVGQEQYWRGKNQTGSTIPNGTVVYATGALGASGIMTIAKYIADGSIPAIYVLGITTEEILDGGDGFVTTFGKIRMLDTSAFSDGDVLYPSATVAGALTNIAPSFPQKRIPLAMVINSHAVAGTIAVRVPTPDQTADEVGYNNAGSTLTATDVQSAINELDAEKGNLSGGNIWSGNQDFGGMYWNDTTNRLGIGTTSPSAPLHVMGEMRLGNTIGTGYSMWLSSDTGAGGTLLYADPMVQTAGQSANVRMFRSTNTTGATSLQIFKGNGTSTSNAVISGNGSSYVSADNGNFGVGTNNPGEKLHVNGGIRIGNTTNAVAGNVRWNGTKFQGYTGTVWVDFH